MINLPESGHRGLARRRLTSHSGHRGTKMARTLVKVWELDGTVHHAGIARSLKFMRKNFDAKIKIAGLEKVAGLSRRGFLKAFLRQTGHKPGEVLRQLRIEHAKRLLVEQDLPLTVLARQSGFRSANTFCVAFQRMTGFSPKKFQRQAWLTTYINQRNGPSPSGGRRLFSNRRSRIELAEAK